MTFVDNDIKRLDSVEVFILVRNNGEDQETIRD